MTVPVLSVRDELHPALDYERLREEGIRHLEQLAGQLWTDFNVHDPGITILETVCYAITDLAYRASYDIPDLLASAGVDVRQSLYSPATILTSRPVTLLDLRKLMLDVDGVKNAWIETQEETEIPLFYRIREGKGELGTKADPPYTTPVLPKGQLRASIETSDLLDLDVAAVTQQVVQRLHGCRPLCSDFVEVEVLQPKPIQVRADVEIGPVDDVETVLVEIYQALAEYISPTVPFATLAELLAKGRRIDEVFDGPVLEHGFLDSLALAELTRKSSINTSDLIRTIMSVPGVRVVRNITVAAGGQAEPWQLRMERSWSPRLDVENTQIRLMKGSITARLDARQAVKRFIAKRRQAELPQRLPAEERDILPSPGRDREIGNYFSIQHQLPAMYGIGESGLPTSASPKRRAQAKQLKAYLLFFDQLLANYFSQLAHAGALLSHDTEDPSTYFTQMIDDPNLGLDSIRERTGHQKRLDEITESTTDADTVGTRRSRFLNHLMARFAEQFTDYSLVVYDALNPKAGASLARRAVDQRAFLRQYPWISSARGNSFDLMAARSEGRPGLEERLVRKLGLDDKAGERFFVIEHLLLRPLREDNVPPNARDAQALPLLASVFARDPYSLSVSFVFPSERGRLSRSTGIGFASFVEQTVREETPAHVAPYIHWLSEPDWKEFETAHKNWIDAYGTYRGAKVGLRIPSGSEHIAARQARDEIIELLGLGEAYPLRDLPVRDERLTVAYNKSASIPIELSQRGVTYQLRNSKNGSVIVRTDGGLSVPVEADGTGGTIFLVTPPMRDDTTYLILAKKKRTGREAYLLRSPTVKVGLDLALAARILSGESLDPKVEHPGDDAPRIVDYDTLVRVQLDDSQEGVDYRLVCTDGATETKLSEDVRGNLGNIVLVSNACKDDVDLRIRATKTFAPAEGRPTQTDLLKVVLPLKVRANRGLALTLEPGPIIDYAANPSVRIDATQTSATYRLFARPVSDKEFLFNAPAPGILSVDVPGEQRVNVLRPSQGTVWEELAGFAPCGSATPGNGGTLRLPVGALKEDSFVLVQAKKEHRAAVNITSAVQLDQAKVILVRPDVNPGIQLTVMVAGTKTDGTLAVTGGQAGVLYFVRRDPDGADLGLPAYFHKVDEQDPTVNKGIGQLRVEVDLAISRGTQRPAATASELAATPPLSPVLDTGPIDLGTKLYLRAVKAQTRVSVKLAKQAQMDSLPDIKAEPATVASGSPATIVVHASVIGERYQLTLDGKPIGPPQDGNSKDLKFTTDPIASTTRFEMRVTRSGESGIPLERRVLIGVAV